MKFQDISQLKQSHYRINVPLKSLIETLYRYEKSQEKFGYKFELNPWFQRGHVWTESQQISFIEWLLKGGSTGLDIYFNHPGWQGDYKGDMVCVDGLQRLTACIRFLSDEIPAFGAYYSEYEDQIHSLTGLYFNIGSFSEIEAVEWYLEMNFTGTPHSENELYRVALMIDRIKHERDYF